MRLFASSNDHGVMKFHSGQLGQMDPRDPDLEDFSVEFLP